MVLIQDLITELLQVLYRHLRPSRDNTSTLASVVSTTWSVQTKGKDNRLNEKQFFLIDSHIHRNSYSALLWPPVVIVKTVHMYIPLTSLLGGCRFPVSCDHSFPVGSITSRCSGKEPALLPRMPLLGEGRRPDTRERRKLSLLSSCISQTHKEYCDRDCVWISDVNYQFTTDFKRSTPDIQTT